MSRHGRLRVQLHVLFYREGDSWVAHCLEFDLMGDGPTKEQALDNLSDAISIQVKASIDYGNLRNLFSPADGEYFEKFAAGGDVAEGVLTVELRRLQSASPIIERVDVRECEDCQDLVPA